MSDDFATIIWLRRLATEAGKGVVNNIDGRTLGRVADRLEAMNAQVETANEAWVLLSRWENIAKNGGYGPLVKHPIVGETETLLNKEAEASSHSSTESRGG